jgi:hypothetical protein
MPFNEPTYFNRVVILNFVSVLNLRGATHKRSPYSIEKIAIENISKYMKNCRYCSCNALTDSRVTAIMFKMINNEKNWSNLLLAKSPKDAGLSN